MEINNTPDIYPRMSWDPTRRASTSLNLPGHFFNLAEFKSTIKVRVPTLRLPIFIFCHLSRYLFFRFWFFIMPPRPKWLLSPSSRSFCTTSPCNNQNPILNRYSRRVTQPKDQGASQVNASLQPLHPQCSSSC